MPSVERSAVLKPRMTADLFSNNLRRSVGSSLFIRLLPVFLAMAALRPQAISAQSLISKLQWLRTLEMANQRFAENGMKVRPKPLEALTVRSDSLRRIVYDQLHPPGPEPEPSPTGFQIFSVQAISVDDARNTRSRFHNRDWAFLGNTSSLPIDTLFTRDIRARLEFHFGAPTVAVGEIGGHGPGSVDEFIQFEYWFVLNDSIPAILIDVNGPWDRGVIMSVPSPFRDTLFDIKQSFLEQLSGSLERMPFADYYYNPEQGQWYVTLFDGASFYDVRIDPPLPNSGRPELGSYLFRTIKSTE